MTTDRGMDKEDVAYLYNGMLLSQKKEWNDDICSNTDTPGDYYSKRNNSERERLILWHPLYVESKIWHKWTHLQNRSRLPDIENRLVVGEWGAGGVGLWVWD